MHKKLNLAILGAGGIGCYYGARLASNGHNVCFITRGDHLTALRKKGLTIKHPDFEFHEVVHACDLEDFTREHEPANFDAIIVCVKATATEEIAENIKRWFKASKQSTMIISLQNGIDNESQLASALDESLIIGGLAVRIGGHIVRPGEVEATGVAEIVLGAWPHADSAVDMLFTRQLSTIIEAFNQSGIPTRKTDNIRRELWRKLVINNGVNPLSALTGLDTRAMAYHPHFGPIVHHLMEEAASMAIADDEPLSQRDADEMFELIRNFDPIKTSMLVDLEKGRPLELESISGAVIARSKQINAPVPYTETVYALLKHKINPSVSRPA